MCVHGVSQSYEATFTGKPKSPYVSPSKTVNIMGIPFSFQITVPYSYGAWAQLDAAANVQFFAKASGTIKRGIQILQSDTNKIPQPISETEPLTFTADMKFVQANVVVRSNVWFLITLIPTVSGFGGPQLSIRFFADGMIGAGSSPSGFTKGLTGCGASTTMAKVLVTAGIHISIGAQLSIKIGGTTRNIGGRMDDMVVLAEKFTLLNGCMDLSALRPFSVPPLLSLQSWFTGTRALQQSSTPIPAFSQKNTLASVGDVFTGSITYSGSSCGSSGSSPARYFLSS
jgi:hypothetical protein